MPLWENRGKVHNCCFLLLQKSHLHQWVKAWKPIVFHTNKLPPEAEIFAYIWSVCTAGVNESPTISSFFQHQIWTGRKKLAAYFFKEANNFRPTPPTPIGTQVPPNRDRNGIKVATVLWFSGVWLSGGRFGKRRWLVPGKIL